MSFGRMWGIVLRHIFLTMHQLERFADLFIFPIVGLLLWGFLSQSVAFKSSNLAIFFIGGLILWTMFERVGTGIGIDFMWDIWERNLMNVLASPITLVEHIGGLVWVSIIKVMISIAAMWVIAAIFYGFNLGSLGSSLIFLWANIVIFAVSLGIFNVALIIRYGHILGPLTWIIPFAIQPFTAAFYPVSIFPPLIQKIVWFLPLSHVFEGMRFTLSSGKLALGQLEIAFVLNLVYFALAIAFFSYMFSIVRKKGTVAKL